MTIDGRNQPLQEATEKIGTGMNVTQTPMNTHRTDHRKTATSALTAAGAETSIIAPQMPPVYISNNYGGTLT